MQICTFRSGISFLCLLIFQQGVIVNAQTCPPNIDFETGTFNGWQCYLGTAEEVGRENVIDLYPVSSPTSNRQTMYTSNTGNAKDAFGGFPVNCPNGSGHSIRLGNSSAGTEAEGISYEFTIPADQEVYSLIYHYAVVFQDPNHEQWQQPRLVIEITNVTDNKRIDCSSFTFIPYGSLLPGFFESPNSSGGTPVWYKDWSAVSVNLDGNAGKKIRLFFKTADCTFRRHFGYAYIDVNSECSSEFVGTTYCNDDTAVNLTAPYGYQEYDNSYTNIIGKQQTLRFTPPPPSGSIYSVTVVPYNGYGCVDTLHAVLVDSLTVNSFAGNDTLSCNKTPVPLGGNSKPGLVYTWSPEEGLSDPNVSNPVATPDRSTTYVLTTNHDGGGCLSQDTVTIVASIIDSTIQLTGSPFFCSDSGDSAILHVEPTERIQWVVDNTPIYGASQPNFRVAKSGTYYAFLVNLDGCSLSTKPQNILIEDPRAGITYPIVYAVNDLPLELSARNFGDTTIWSPGTSLNNRTGFNPTFTGSADQLYTILMKAKSGCVTIDTQLVKTVEKVEVFVPNAFSPNSDGINDVLRPVAFGMKELHYFKIFNRAGQMLFETSKLNIGWDGRFKGAPQLSQVVAWIMEGVGFDSRIYTRKGTSLLVR